MLKKQRAVISFDEEEDAEDSEIGDVWGGDVVSVESEEIGENCKMQGRFCVCAKFRGE